MEAPGQRSNCNTKHRCPGLFDAAPGPARERLAGGRLAECTRKSTACSFNPVLLCRKLLDQEQSPDPLSVGTTRTHSTEPLTRGTLMKVRADETHTLENCAGHSAVSGAHRRPAGSRPGVRSGGLTRLPQAPRPSSSTRPTSAAAAPEQPTRTSSSSCTTPLTPRSPWTAGPSSTARPPARRRPPESRPSAAASRRRATTWSRAARNSATSTAAELPAADAVATGLNPSGTARNASSSPSRPPPSARWPPARSSSRPTLLTCWATAPPTPSRRRQQPPPPATPTSRA